MWAVSRVSEPQEDPVEAAQNGSSNGECDHAIAIFNI